MAEILVMVVAVVEAAMKLLAHDLERHSDRNCDGGGEEVRRPSSRAHKSRSARLRVTLVTGEPPAPAVVGADDFDPSDHAAFAEIAGFVFGGPPRGQ
jgi:hypothetical protein